MSDIKTQEPTLNDIGTRYEHLKDHCEALEAVIEILSSKNNLSMADKQRLIKLTVAAEVTRNTLDAYSGYNEGPVQYQLYHLLNNIPVKPEYIEGGRGTPLV